MKTLLRLLAKVPVSLLGPTRLPIQAFVHSGGKMAGLGTLGWRLKALDLKPCGDNSAQVLTCQSRKGGEMSYLFTVLCLFVSLAASPAAAYVVYSYEGPNFTEAGNVPPIPPGSGYNTTMNVAGSFTTHDLLPPASALTDYSSSVVEYAFSDGVQRLYSNNSHLDFLRLIVNGQGQIVEWSIGTTLLPLATAVGETIAAIETSWAPSAPRVIDAGGIARCVSVLGGTCVAATQQIPGDGFGVVRGPKGVWTVEQVPEPATFALLGLGLAGLAASRRRK